MRETQIILFNSILLGMTSMGIVMTMTTMERTMTPVIVQLVQLVQRVALRPGHIIHRGLGLGR